MNPPINLPARAYAAALAELPGMGPARLVSLLREARPEETWQRVLSGEIRRAEPSPGLPGAGARLAWAEAASRSDVARRWSAIERDRIGVTYFGRSDFPAPLIGDPDPPGVLFWCGDLGILEFPRVAIIGTRHCTNYGRTVAIELGRDLATSGVCVVSGLALGIDGAAHQGALLAAGTLDAVGPLGVAASGVDMPYPRKHAELWRQVARAGAIISETPPRRPAQSWRFPARNRIIAGSAQAVVVVESHAAGGSMLTVAAAADRGIEVLAVPGPVTSPSSIGTNQLLYEGLTPVRHAGDVLAAIGDLRSWPAQTGGSGGSGGRSSVSRQPPGLVLQPGCAEQSPISRELLAPRLPAERSGPAHREQPERRVLDAIDRTATSTSVIADRTGLPIGALSVLLLRLEGVGLVQGRGTWWERCDQE